MVHHSVVPAKAGTYTPKEKLWREAFNSESSPNPIPWLWVPAFAGTTVQVALRALPNRTQPRALYEIPIILP